MKRAAHRAPGAHGRTTSMPKPIRIKRSRIKGSRLRSPNGLPIVCVSRPSKWGNPYPIPSDASLSPEHKAKLRAASIQRFERALRGKSAARLLGFTAAEVARALRGKNLACWCPLNGPCHADVLLAIANPRSK